MEIINIFYYLAIILIFAKVFGLIARKIGLPQVAGMVVAGVLIGLMGYLNDPDNIFRAVKGEKIGTTVKE